MKFKVINFDEFNFEILNEEILENDEYIKLDENVAKLVQIDLDKNKLVICNKKTMEISVTSKKDENICLSPIKREVVRSLKEKYLCINDINVMTDMVFYVDSLLSLADAGYFITDENREEKYIEIIETEDEQLIDMLETYLESKDEISKIKWNKKQYLKNLKELETLDENSEEFKKFISSI